MLKFIRSLLLLLHRRRRPSSKPPTIIVHKLGKPPSKSRSAAITTASAGPSSSSPAAVHPNFHPRSIIRVATFNASLFSMAPAVPATESPTPRPTTPNPPKSILKQSPLHSSSEGLARSRLRVSINLPDNEISLGRSRRLDGKASYSTGAGGSGKSVLDALRELDVDILALQDVKAEEERLMKPLSDLAAALGMNYYVFAESWAPEYGNAVLSRWPIKRWRVHKIFDDSDFRNVLKTTIDVPNVGEMNFYCTHLDHLNEDWRMKQINSIIQSNDAPHILAGALNSLDETDYSQERWTDIVKYYEEMGKPSPKAEVMRFLKGKQYTDAKNFAGECESVVVIAKGQSVQGTCKYGTRLDYILASAGSPYKFVPGSYSVYSSKGTSDHHIVKVDIEKVECIQEIVTKKRQQYLQQKKRVVKMTGSASPKGVWKRNKQPKTEKIYIV